MYFVSIQYNWKRVIIPILKQLLFIISHLHNIYTCRLTILGRVDLVNGSYLCILMDNHTDKNNKDVVVYFQLSWGNRSAFTNYGAFLSMKTVFI